MNKQSIVMVILFALVTTLVALPASAATVITEDTILTADQYEGIVIDTDGVTLDCNGYSITGDGSAGVLIRNAENVEVKNCVIDGFDHGILVDGHFLNFVRNVTLKSNTISSPVYHGISLQGAYEFTVKNNTVTGGPGQLGYVLIDSAYGDVKDNVALGDLNRGFTVIWGSGWNVLRGNASDGPAYGFHVGLQSGPENTFIDNHATGAGLGFFIDRDSYEPIEMRANRAEGNDVGFQIEQSSGQHLLTGNHAEDNFQGFVLKKTSGNSLVGNTATRNDAAGFQLEFSTHNLIQDNVSNRNERGFDFWDRSSWNDVTGNTADHNSLLGFWLTGPTTWQGSQYNVFTGNRACHNGVWDAGEPYPSPNVENTFTDNRFCVTALYNIG